VKPERWQVILQLSSHSEQGTNVFGKLGLLGDEFAQPFHWAPLVMIGNRL